MQFQKYVLVAAIIMSLVVPNEGILDFIFKPLGKIICEKLFEIGCPAVAIATAVAAVAGTLGKAAPVVVPVVGAATKGCHVMQKASCKRSVKDKDTILIPFSDNFDNYDYNGDKMIEYHEFMKAVTSSVGLIHPDELVEPFVFADADGNHMIDTDEFKGAPFVFGRLTAGDILNMTGIKTE